MYNIRAKLIAEIVTLLPVVYSALLVVLPFVTADS